MGRRIVDQYIDVRFVGYLCAALTILPAAIIVALYPMNWVLGTVPFSVSAFDVDSVRTLFLIPVLVGALIAQAKKSWVLALMLLPGPVLMLSAPDRLGTVPPMQADSAVFYPESYNTAEVLKKIQRLESELTQAGWRFQLVALETSSPERLKSLNTTAAEAVSLWRGGLDMAKATADLKARLAQLTAARATLAKNPACGFKIGCAAWQKKLADLDQAIKDLNTQIAGTAAAATPEAKYALAVRATAAVKVELQMAESRVREQIAFAEAIPYIAAASIAFLVMMYVAGFRSSALALLTASTLAVGMWSNLKGGLDIQFVDAMLATYPAFVCVASAFVLRFLYRAYLDNRVIPNQFDRLHIAKSGALTALIWLPFPLIVIGVVLLNQWVYAGVSDVVYCKVDTICGADASKFPVQDSDPSRDTLRDDIVAATARQFAQFEAEALSNAELAKSGVAAQVQAANDKIMQTFNRVLPPNIFQIFPELTPPSTRDYIGFLYFRPLVLVRRLAFLKVNEAYQGPRNSMEARLKATIADVGAKVTGGVANTADTLKSAIKGESENAARAATRAIDASFLLLNVLSLSQLAIMLVVATRAYLLGLGRVLYRAPTKMDTPTRATPYLRLSHSGLASLAGAEPKVYPDEFSVDKRHLPLLAKRSYGANNAYQSTLLWRSLALGWPLRRLRNRCLLIRHVSAMDEVSPVHYTSGAGRSFVVWTIPPGSCVSFDWTKFVAMSVNLTLKKDITLRVGGLTLGTTMHAYVIGGAREGILIQEGYGDINLFHEQPDPAVGAPMRLMSWRNDAEFKIASPPKVSNIYFDTPSLDPKTGSRGVLDSGGGNDKGWGIIGELLSLVRP